MSAYSRLADLSLVVEGYELEGLVQQVSSDFARHTTVIHLLGAGEEGAGEDVTYEAEEQARFQGAGPTLDLAGAHTLASLSGRFEGMPDYRRWGFESAALDLALRQGGLSLHEALGRTPQPVTFVVSTGLGSAGVDRLRGLLEQHPELRFKLDATSEWDRKLVAELAELDCVDVVDFKEAYTWREPEVAAGPEVYRLVAELLPTALIEDPGVADPEKAGLLEPHRNRVTWDAAIHSVADIDALSFPPQTLNSKPSRFGSVKALCDFYDVCAERGIELYGGGQFELGPGRGQVQYLASLFHPGAPNDVAPGAYNRVPVPDGLPDPPLPPAPEEIGFRWLQG